MGALAGELVNDQVRLVRLLGRGGMGSVWVAHHEGLAIDVAVKFIAPELAVSGGEVVIARFRREARLAARLDNPHTVRVLDHGVTDDGTPYIVMELLEGESLAEWLRRVGRAPITDAVQIVRELAIGLEHAHALGIIHRDVKPPNVFLSRSRDGRRVTKILDFGIAKTQESSDPAQPGTSSGVLIGTPHYMSPEQLMHAGPPDKSADVWALAVVAFEMLVGQPPFSGETLAATLVAITQASMRKQSGGERALNAAQDAFFARALSIDPKRRFPTALALAEAFEAAASGVSIPPPSPPLEGDTRSDPNLPTAEFLRLSEGPAPLPGERTEIGASHPDLALAPTLLGVTSSDPPRAKEAAPAPSRRRGSSTSRSVLVLGGAAAAAVAGVVAYRATTPPPPPAALGEATAQPVVSEPSPPPSSRSVVASAPPTASASVAPTAEVLAIPRTPIEKGYAPNSGLFVTAFDIAREPGDEGADFVGALHACERKKMSLCTEAQWQRACETIEGLGRHPSWTLSSDDRGVAVRGGSDCTTRAVASVESREPSRIGVCCTRAIGGSSSNQKNPNFLITTSAKLLMIERLFNAANGGGLAEMSAPKLNLFGKMVDHAEAGVHVGWVGRSESFYFDTCDSAVHDVGNLRGWGASCVGIVVTRKNEIARATRWISFGDGGLLEEIREPKARVDLGPPKPKPASSSRAP